MSLIKLNFVGMLKLFRLIEKILSFRSKMNTLERNQELPTKFCFLNKFETGKILRKYFDLMEIKKNWSNK